MNPFARGTGSNSTGAYRIYVQLKGDVQPLAVGRRHKTIIKAREAVDKQFQKHGSNMVYAEIHCDCKIVGTWMSGKGSWKKPRKARITANRTPMAKPGWRHWD